MARRFQHRPNDAEVSKKLKGNKRGPYPSLRTLIALVSVIAALCLGCNRKSPVVHYVFPDGYRGVFVIYTNRADGAALEYENGVYLCPIPASGIVLIKGDGPFYHWHRTTATFAGGKNISIASETPGLPDGVVAFWRGGSRTGGMIYDFIGTRAEAEAFRKEPAGSDVKVGGVRKD